MPSPFTEAFDTIARQTLDRFHVPGLAISVVHGSETYATAYGNIQQDPPVETKTSSLFYVASTTKAIFCAAWTIYIASEANTRKPKCEQIQWSTPIASIIGEDSVLSDSSRTSQITLEDCVSHRTGMSAHNAIYGGDGLNDVKSIVRHLRYLPMHTPLRSKFEYNNLMYVAASHALEKLTGKSVAQVLRESIWSPLGMEQTYAGYDEAHEAEKTKGEVLVTNYSWSKMTGEKDESDGQLNKEVQPNLSEVSGAGYVISSVEDYAKWMRALLFPSENGPITEKIREEIWNPRSVVQGMANIPFDGVSSTYALGWFLTSYHGHAIYRHPGGLVGGGSIVILCPDLKWGVTFFGNGAGVDLKLRGLAIELLDIALGVPEAERVSRKKTESYFVELSADFAKPTETAKKSLYPDAPSKPEVPLGLPLQEYAGTYHHMAYGNLKLEVGRGREGRECLTATPNRTFGSVIELEPINAEHWLLAMRSSTSSAVDFEKAQSEIGVDGKVQRFGLTMETSMPDTLIWFDREK